ncbi:MAG: 2-phospho-L-lactate transferase CofD family protein [Ilumatobacteraceae bacterium]
MITVLCGGVGAARFLRALRAEGSVPTTDVVGVVNTADDTVLHGLSISPDLDTITYTLAGAIDPERMGTGRRDLDGDGRARPLRTVRPVGSSAAPTWFNLGDRDLATHFYRTARLGEEPASPK